MLRDLDILKIDYTAADAGYRITETHNVSDLNGRILIPYEGPLFARNLVVRGDGAPLTLEKDYTLEDDFTELELMTGKKVIGSLRFSSRIQSDYKEIKITYQKVGEFIISRQFLINSLAAILDSDKPIDWLTQVFGKPDTYPPAYHEHDIRNKNEIVGFHDLMILFKQASGEVKQGGRELWEQLKAIEQKAFKTLNDTYTALWNKMFSHIMNVNVPHPMTKADIELGSHPNFETATKDEDMDAAFYDYDELKNGKLVLRNDAISTPLGLRAAIDNFEINTDGFIRQGSLPFSYYGSGFYIPPPISGSFEGLGTNTGGSAMCLEPNGWTTILTRGYDSKVKKLYYYYNKNIYDKKESFIFSGFAYVSQLMENNGDSPNHVLSGSSGRIVVIGDKDTNQYYVGLGNGTLDAQSHQLKKIDMSVFNDPAVGGTMWDPDKAYVMLIGDYVYIVAQRHGWAPEIPEAERFGSSTFRSVSFYRINTAKLTDAGTKELKFERQLMDYQNSEGEWKYKQTYVNIAKNVVKTDNAGKKTLLRCVYGFAESPDNARLGDPWRAQWFNMENPDNKNEAAIRLFHNVRFTYVGRTKNAADWWFCIPMFFNTNTNTLRLDDRFFSITRDPADNKTTYVPEGRMVNEWFHGTIGAYCARHAEVAAAYIPKLGYATCGTTTYLLPYNTAISFMGNNPNESYYTPDLTDWERFNQNLLLLDKNGYTSKSIPLDSPFGFTSQPAFQRDLWEYNGKTHPLPVEIFSALNAAGNKSTWYREALENYTFASREAFTFKYIDKDIIGRVPSTKFGQTRVGKLTQSYSARVPIVNTSFKNKLGVQYGIANVVASSYNASTKTHDATGGLYYSDVSETTVNVSGVSDIYLGLIGKHTLDKENGVLQVDNIRSESVCIPKAQWFGLFKKLMGNHFSDVSGADGGRGRNGEWVGTLFISAQEGSGSNVIPCVALVHWHTFSDPKTTYAAYATFNWKTTSKKSTGEKVIELINITYPDAKYAPNANTVISTNYSYNANGYWSIDSGYGSQSCVPEVQVDFTDNRNYHLWLGVGITMTVPLNSSGVRLDMVVENGITTSRVDTSGMYNGDGYVNHKLYVTDLGMCAPVSPKLSGGAALYVNGGKVPDNEYAILQAVFIEGNWTLFINSEMTALFNGSEKSLGKRNYDLSQLGVGYKNKTFYLYAVSGKAQGYYDLSLSERTASPYHLLVATIRTNAFGIEEIDVQQRFAISGFTITTANQGGSIPATTGTFPDKGEFEAIVKEDLFDTSQYK